MKQIKLNTPYKSDIKFKKLAVKVKDKTTARHWSCKELWEYE